MSGGSSDWYEHILTALQPHPRSEDAQGGGGSGVGGGGSGGGGSS